ncbi:MAG TPA: exo-alpha-sialidase, partial [Piscinibacter sp.]|nr:exo-alpha-sialidase [Piscinibacter sp.]
MTIRLFPARWRTIALALLVALYASAALAQHAEHAPAKPKKRAPALAMGAAFAPSGELWVVALDEQQRLAVQTSADEGKTWAAPRVLARGDDAISADGENRPKIAFGPSGQVVISYTQPLARPYTGAIRMLRST